MKLDQKNKRKETNPQHAVETDGQEKGREMVSSKRDFTFLGEDTKVPTIRELEIMQRIAKEDAEMAEKEDEKKGDGDMPVDAFIEEKKGLDEPTPDHHDPADKKD